MGKQRLLIYTSSDFPTSQPTIDLLHILFAETQIGRSIILRVQRLCACGNSPWRGQLLYRDLEKQGLCTEAGTRPERIGATMEQAGSGSRLCTLYCSSAVQRVHCAVYSLFQAPVLDIRSREVRGGRLDDSSTAADDSALIQQAIASWTWCCVDRRVLPKRSESAGVWGLVDTYYRSKPNVPSHSRE